jgi:hypothetical protein
MKVRDCSGQNQNTIFLHRALRFFGIEILPLRYYLYAIEKVTRAKIAVDLKHPFHAEEVLEARVMSVGKAKAMTESERPGRSQRKPFFKKKPSGPGSGKSFKGKPQSVGGSRPFKGKPSGSSKSSSGPSRGQGQGRGRPQSGK